MTDPGQGYDDYHFERRRGLAPPTPEVARRRQLITAVVGAVVVLAVVALGWSLVSGDDGSDTATDGSATTTDEAAATTDAGGGPDDAGTGGSGGKDLTQVPAKATDDFVNPDSSGRMWSKEVPGSLTFRGNPTRTYYGRGEVPTAPKVRWFYPEEGGMCASSTVGDGPRSGAAPAGRASPRCSSGTAAPGWCSAPTTRPCTSSTATPARTSSRPSPPATSSRVPSPSTPTATRSSTPAAGTTTTG